MFRKRSLVLLIFSAALILWMVRESEINEARRYIQKNQAELVKLTNYVLSAEENLESLRAELRDAKRRRDESLVAVHDARQQLFKDSPESRWVTPPNDLPAWIEESPYIWLRKDRLDVLSVQPFNNDGTLRGEMLTVLVTTPEQNAALANRLPALLNEYRVMEASKARYLDKPLSGIENGTIKTVSLEPIPEEGATIKKRFEAALRETVGSQRADLILRLSEPWLDEQFGQTGAARTISVVRHPDGEYNLSIKGKNNWFSCGVPKRFAGLQFKDHIPPHVLPMFADIIPELDENRPEQ